MKPIRSSLYLLFCTLFPLLLHAAPLEIPKVDDWSAEAVVAQRASKPIMVVFGSDSCSYCEALNREILAPKLRKGSLPQHVHLREFNIDRGGKVIDFDGAPVRSRLFVARYHIFATPTVLLLDENGRILGEPIVGYNGADAYPALLQQAIQQAEGVFALAARTRDPALRQ